MSSVFMDFAIASVLILLGQLLRAKVPLIQQFFVPAGLIAGLIGLALGKYGLGILAFSEHASSYASLLILVVFTAVGVQGFSFSNGGSTGEAKRVAGFFSYRAFSHCCQVVIPILISITVIASLVPDINNAFGFILIAGFCGGHGTAAAVGVELERLGFVNAMDLCMTSATVGILVGVFGGMILIKIATRKGYTEFIKDFRYISGELRTGMIPKDKQQSIGMDGVSVVSLDPMAWHLALILVPAGLGLLGAKALTNLFGLSVPDYCIGFLFGLLFWSILSKLGVYEYVDTEIFNRISGCATDYLVFFGVALISVPIVMEYAIPLLILMGTGIVIVVLTYYVFGPGMNDRCWCERSLFCYGYLTGVFAIGFVLLRIVDPANKSKTLNDIAITSPFTTMVEIFTWSFCPIMLATGQAWMVISVFGAGAIVCLLFSFLTKQWFFKKPLVGRGNYD